MRHRRCRKTCDPTRHLICGASHLSIRDDLLIKPRRSASAASMTFPKRNTSIAFNVRSAPAVAR